MPLYEYECLQCHQRVEKIQSFSAPEITECPKCGGTLERVISAPAVQFKGSGWYVSDYAAKKPASKGTESKTETKSETKTETKSESKPATGTSSAKE
jgi:putative FmdB family regulatory protein